MESKVKQVYRLTPVMYRELERQCGNPALGSDGDGIRAAYLLGIQHVLQKVRVGFTMEED